MKISALSIKWFWEGGHILLLLIVPKRTYLILFYYLLTPNVVCSFFRRNIEMMMKMNDVMTEWQNYRMQDDRKTWYQDDSKLRRRLTGWYINKIRSLESVAQPNGIELKILCQYFSTFNPSLLSSFTFTFIIGNILDNHTPRHQSKQKSKRVTGSV